MNILTDRTALARNRTRHSPAALFLHQQAIDEIRDRLQLVNRSFQDIAVISGFPKIWQAAFPKAMIVPDLDILAIPNESYDLVIHAMALHWSNDIVGQLIQCRQSLRPDGLFLAVCFGGRSLEELRAVLAEAEITISGGLSPRVAPMTEIRELGGLLQRTRFALPVADSVRVTAKYASPRALMHELRAMGEANALAARLRRPTASTVLCRAEVLYQTKYGTPDGHVTATFELIYLTGWAPDSSQPQALRPGSATTQLAEVLSTTETPLKE